MANLVEVYIRNYLVWAIIENFANIGHQNVQVDSKIEHNLSLSLYTTSRRLLPFIVGCWLK